MLDSVTKLTIGSVPLLRPRCKHMFLQMHAMNDPNQSYAGHSCPIDSIAGRPFPYNIPYPIKSSRTVVNMVPGLK